MDESIGPCVRVCVCVACARGCVCQQVGERPLVGEQRWFCCPGGVPPALCVCFVSWETAFFFLWIPQIQNETRCNFGNSQRAFFFYFFLFIFYESLKKRVFPEPGELSRASFPCAHLFEEDRLRVCRAVD